MTITAAKKERRKQGTAADRVLQAATRLLIKNQGNLEIIELA